MVVEKCSFYDVFLDMVVEKCSFYDVFLKVVFKKHVNYNEKVTFRNIRKKEKTN